MSDAPPPPPSPSPAKPDYAQARTRAHGLARFNLIWLFPLVAVVVAGWLGYKTWSERGPTITITFLSGEGLEAGKSHIKHKDVDIGLIKTVELSPGLDSVVVTAEMSKTVAGLLSDQSRFWVVRPRIGAGGVSGLGTLLSGAYVEMDPRPGERSHAFAGLETPPVVASDVPGRQFLLKTGRIGGINSGSPIFFRDIVVGRILGYDFNDDKEEMTIHAFVHAPHDKLVYEGSRFWNASGLKINAEATGVKVEVESLEALLRGGVAFETPVSARLGQPAKADTVFPLFADFDSVGKASYTRRIPFIVDFESGVGGLGPGSPVQMRGLTIGQVTDVHLEFDVASTQIHAPVTIEIEPERLIFVGERPVDADPIKVVEELVSRGLRAQLKTGNILTGQQIVSLDFFANAPPAKLIPGHKYPLLPSVPNTLQEITQSVTGLLNKLDALPLEKVVDDLHVLLGAVAKLVQTPELKKSVVSLDKTMDWVQNIAKATDKDIGPLLSGALKALGSLDGVLRQAESNSALQRDLRATLGEIRDAARSVRVLMDLIEAHPESVIRGKGKDISP